MNGSTKRTIERRWQAGYFLPTIAAELQLPVGQVARELLNTGKHPLTVFVKRSPGQTEATPKRCGARSSSK